MSIKTRISHALLIPEPFITRLINSAPYRYKVYLIPKKNGNGTRTIAQPSRAVKAVQYWTMENVLNTLPIHRAATAYRKGVNIADNAGRHAPHRFLLKLDFENFFTSITASDLETYFRLHPQSDLTQHDVANLKRILFWNRERSGQLVMSIGAPSSPTLSNILMFDFDSSVQRICDQRNVQYTRYADDLTFSTSERNVLREIKFEIEQVCRQVPYPRLSLNEPKTVHASRAKSRRVTGLTLTNDGSVSIGRERKRIIRAQIDHFLSGRLEPDRLAELQGMLSFVSAVEPEFIEKLRRRYADGRLQAILPIDSSTDSP